VHSKSAIQLQLQTGQKNLLKFGDGSYVQIGEWEADDELSFKASKYNFTNGNLGIGVTAPQYKLDVNGKLYLHTVDLSEGLKRSYLYWEGHRLVMGVPQGVYSHAYVDIIPSTSNQGCVYSQLTLYSGDTDGNLTAGIKFNTSQNCWINTTEYVGIGTTNPLYKLDVNGTIRAKEIIVQSSGADFKNYNLLSLSELKQYVNDNHHLPEILSAEQMQQDGVSLDKLAIQLLQKLEEQTLYIIQLEERISELEKNK